MANEVAQKIGGTAAAEVVWADVTDYTPGTAKPTRTAQIDLTSLANSAARQGDKADLGATQAPLYSIEVDLEFDVVPTAGNVVEVYLAWSNDPTAGDRNPGGVAGADGAYTGKNSNISASVKQLDGPFIFICSAGAAAPDDQRMIVGVVQPKARYVTPVIYNTSGQALEGDAVEMYVSLLPLLPEVQ